LITSKTRSEKEMKKFKRRIAEAGIQVAGDRIVLDQQNAETCAGIVLNFVEWLDNKCDEKMLVPL
jgi:hypothetical protein